MLLRLLLIANLLLTVWMGFAFGQVVSIPDPNLRAAIEDALKKTPGALITTTEAARLTRLEAPVPTSAIWPGWNTQLTILLGVLST